MKQDENLSSDTPLSPKSEHEQSSDYPQSLEQLIAKLDRLANAIEVLAASNYELLNVIVNPPEEEPGPIGGDTLS